MSNKPSNKERSTAKCPFRATAIVYKQPQEPVPESKEGDVFTAGTFSIGFSELLEIIMELKALIDAEHRLMELCHTPCHSYKV